jgi:succinate dehydrogenase/fumarate reductase-like Fe-S protein
MLSPDEGWTGNCTEVYLKGLNPARAIERIKVELLRRST